ncbi:MAG: ligand-binding sensor domain-containing protein, partial [bacterium]
MKHFKINSLFILIILTLPGELFASYRFEHFSNKEGFNQNTITDIEQDKYGFLWFATPNGLIKYDGYDFISYTNNPGNLNSISNNNIQRLAQDQYGNLWIGTFEGVNVYIPQYEKFLAVPFTKNILISSISIGSKGNVWISGDDELYICELEKKGTDFSFKISDNLLKTVPDISTIVDFCFINENNILVAHTDGLTHLEYMDIPYHKNHNLKSFHHLKEFENHVINTIYKNGSLFWIGTNNGIFKTVPDGNRIQIVDKIRLTTSDNRNVSDLEVLSIFNANDGSIWIGSASEGIFKINEKNGNFEHYGFNKKDETGITSSRINCFFQDNFGVIWIGTAQGGVNKLDLNQKPFYTYSNNPYDEESIGGNLIMDIIEDKEGKIWIPSYNGTLSRSINPVKRGSVGQLKFEQLRDQLSLEKNDHINTIFEDDKGLIWMGTETSIIVFNPFEKSYKKVDLMRDGKSFSFNSVRVIKQIGLDTMLFGGGDGIFIVMDPWNRLKNKNTGFELIPLFNKGGIVNCLEKTNTNHYWIGTERGLFLCTFKSNSFEIVRQFHKDDGDFQLSNSNVFSIHIGIEGNIWVGTFGGGLNKVTLDKKGLPMKIDYYRKDGILPDDAIYGILQEDKEYLWLSTDMGLCRLNIKSNEIDIFDVRDGIANNNFRMRAYYKNDNGVFYFGGLNGLTIFDPSKIQANKEYSIPLITGISVNNKRIKIGEEVNKKVVLQKSPIELNNIIVNHKAKTLTFHILAQQYSTPFKNQLAYFLDGFDSDWIFTKDGKTSVTYTNLPKGNYTLHVKSANEDGIWNESAMNLNITVLPPWYNTWWSYSIYSILVLSIIVGIFIYFIRLEKLQQRLKFEQIDKERIDKLNQGKLQFFTNISHEFRTPLTLISGPLEKIIEKNKEIENSKYLKIIQNNTKR